MRPLFRGTACDKCYQLLNDRNQLFVCVKDRVGKTYNRLKAFEELDLDLDVAEIKKKLSKVEAWLNEEDSPFETVKTQIIGNFEVISKLETTLIFANIDELTNQMQQANIALIEENEKLKKQINLLESLKGKEKELTDQINRLNNEIEVLNTNTDTLTNENKELKNQLNQQKNENNEKTEKKAKQGNSIGMKFTRIPAGEFYRGSEESANEKPVQEVKIKNPFYVLSRYISCDPA
jgi:chromosome segregation ATPase